MYIRKSGVQTLASAYIRTAGAIWTRVDALMRVAGNWRGWFRQTGSLASILNDTWANYNDYGNYEYIGQWRWITMPVFGSPIRFIAGTFSANLENRDTYGAGGYQVCIEGLVAGVWTRLLTSEATGIPAETWQTISVTGEVVPVEVTQIRYGICVKHMWHLATGACTAWEEFGTYVG